jgi:hypothetical protein
MIRMLLIMLLDNVLVYVVDTDIDGVVDDGDDDDDDDDKDDDDDDDDIKSNIYIYILTVANKVQFFSQNMPV